MLIACAEHLKQSPDSCESELSYHLGEAAYHLEQLIKSLEEISVEIRACCNHLNQVRKEIGHDVG